VFHRAVPVDLVAEGRSHGVVLGGWPVVICRADGALHALIDRCSHADSPLAGGRVRGGSLICPLHGARFEVASGRCVGRPAMIGVRRFETRIHDGWLEVDLPDRTPTEADLLGVAS
jgi:nitrite reductase/ring-hydroxylating ferredoxin subunit